MKKYFLLLSAALALGGCGRTVTRGASALDPAVAGAAKKIAIMPVTYGFTYYTEFGGIGSDDPCYEGFFQIGFAVDAMYAEAAKYSGPYEFVPRAAVCAALKEAGFEGFKEKLGVLSLKSAVGKTGGMTVPLALKAGRAAGADAVLLAAVSDTYTSKFMKQSGFRDDMVARLLDARTGAVLWAGRSSEKGSKLAEMAGGLKGHYHLQKRYARQFRRLLDDLGRGPAPLSPEAPVVAILPPDDFSLDFKAIDMVVRMMATGLIRKGYLPVAGRAQDALLYGIGISDGGQLPAFKAEKLAETLGAGSLMYLVIGDFRTLGLNAAAKHNVEIGASLVRADGKPLWDSTGAGSSGGPAYLRSHFTEKVLGIPKLQELEKAVTRLLEKVPDWGSVPRPQ
jgi:hypothetical protein